MNIVETNKTIIVVYTLENNFETHILLFLFPVRCIWDV